MPNKLRERTASERSKNKERIASNAINQNISGADILEGRAKLKEPSASDVEFFSKGKKFQDVTSPLWNPKPDIEDDDILYKERTMGRQNDLRQQVEKKRDAKAALGEVANAADPGAVAAPVGTTDQYNKSMGGAPAKPKVKPEDEEDVDKSIGRMSTESIDYGEVFDKAVNPPKHPDGSPMSREEYVQQMQDKHNKRLYNRETPKKQAAMPMDESMMGSMAPPASNDSLGSSPTEVGQSLNDAGNDMIRKNRMG